MKLDMNTDADDKILTAIKTGIPPIFLLKNSPSLIVRPMQIIIAGNITALFSSVNYGSL